MLVSIVRHSESVNNILAAEIGDKRTAEQRTAFETRRSSDAPLTDRGVAQAERAGQRIAAENGADATLIIASYFHRALRTALAVEQATKQLHPDSKVKVLVDRDFHEGGGMYKTVLKERDVGQDDDDDGGAAAVTDAMLERVGFPGRTVKDVAEEFPSFTFTPNQSCENGWWHSSAKETAEETAVRALFLWHRLAQIARTGEHQSIVVVTHGHLYALMMKVAGERGYFNKDGAAPRNDPLNNTGITRFVVDPAPEDPTGGAATSLAAFATNEKRDVAPGSFKLLLENSIDHVAQLGTLAASNVVPLK